MQHLGGFELVYFIQAEMPEGLVKIGATADFPKRFMGLVGGSPCRLQLLGVQLTERAYTIERRLHHRFRTARDHGEWFRPAPDLMNYIAQQTTNPEHIVVHVEAREATTNEIDTLIDRLDLKPLANISQIAHACNVSVQSIRRHVNERKIPFIRVGRQLRFDMREFFKGRKMEAKRYATVDGAVVGRSDVATERPRAGFQTVTKTPTDQDSVIAAENSSNT